MDRTGYKTTHNKDVIDWDGLAHKVPEDWRSMGGTQLCRHRDHRQMLWSAGKTVPGSLRDLLVEAGRNRWEDGKVLGKKPRIPGFNMI